VKCLRCSRTLTELDGYGWVDDMQDLTCDPIDGEHQVIGHPHSAALVAS
jgi:hypothetical protein